MGPVFGPAVWAIAQARNALFGWLVTGQPGRVGHLQPDTSIAVPAGAQRALRARNALFAYSPQRAALSVLYAAVSTELEQHATHSRDAQPRGTVYLLTHYVLEQGGAAAGQQLIVPVATPWPPHHAMATDAAFGAPLWGE
eukprot:scaffold98808_cov69-Phaeocystis_antarctica.AAC.10